MKNVIKSYEFKDRSYFITETSDGFKKEERKKIYIVIERDTLFFLKVGITTHRMRAIRGKI